MNRNVMRTACFTAFLFGVACTVQPTEEAAPRQITDLDGLRLEVVLDRNTIPVGDSASITMRLRNETNGAVRLVFGSTCQILPYIETTAGVMQYPGGGAWGCGAMITSLDVPGNGVVTRTLVVRGAAAGANPWPISLPPGSYRAYAVLGILPPGVELRSPTVAFEVR